MKETKKSPKKNQDAPFTLRLTNDTAKKLKRQMKKMRITNKTFFIEWAINSFIRKLGG